METWKKFLDQPFLLSDQAVKEYAEEHNLSKDMAKPVIGDLSETRKDMLEDMTLEEAKQVTIDNLVSKALKEEGLA